MFVLRKYENEYSFAIFNKSKRPFRKKLASYGRNFNRQQSKNFYERISLLNESEFYIKTIDKHVLIFWNRAVWSYWKERKQYKTSIVFLALSTHFQVRLFHLNHFFVLKKFTFNYFLNKIKYILRKVYTHIHILYQYILYISLNFDLIKFHLI